METPFNSTDLVVLSLIGTTLEPIAQFTYEEAKQVICAMADKWNHGLARTWVVNGNEYWDCGPKVFIVRAA